MTDPERMNTRRAGLAAQLLRASAEEEPSEASLHRTLAALGVSGAVLTTTSAAGAAAAAGGAQLTSAASAGAGKTVTALLLVKWVGVGVVGGVSLAGAAAVVTSPAVAPAPREVSSVQAPRRAAARVASSPSASPVAPLREMTLRAPEPEPAPAPPLAPRALPSRRESDVAAPPDVGVPLAAEVALVDRARALLAQGRPEAGLSELTLYERAFPEPRLLPEVLFLQLEAYQRLGRTSDARRAAERLASGFPKSPHAARARSLLGERFP
jgi:hypothetical protein